MPKIDVSHADLNALIGRACSIAELEELLLCAKTELDAAEGDHLKLDVKDTNRPDLWSVEGVAREVRLHLGKRDPVAAAPSGIEVRVEPSAHFRPAISCFTAELTITEPLLVQLIQLEEKLAEIYGRKRAAFCIGVYNRAAIQSPIAYRVSKDVRFAPLGFTERMTAKEILERHPKGRAYGHIHAGEDPLVLVDSAGTVLSYIPITNSNDVGRVEPGHSQLFIEGTGTDRRLVDAAMQAMAAALALRGAKIGTVKITPPTGKPFATPPLAPHPVSIEPAAIRAAAGLPLPDAELRKLLERSGYTILKATAKSWSLEAPFYRADLMHWRDIAEDVLIAYGYNNIEPLPLAVASSGNLHPLTELESRAAAAMTGLGFQEVLTYTLTNRAALERTQLPARSVVEIANPVSATWSVFRTSLLPSLLSVLSQNQHNEYPQKIFEVGNVILPDPTAETRATDELRLAAVIADSRVNYADLLATALAFASQFGVALVPKAHADPAFLPGRCALLTRDGNAIGIIGETHPHALTSWGLGKPVAAFELRLAPLG